MKVHVCPKCQSEEVDVYVQETLVNRKAWEHLLPAGSPIPPSRQTSLVGVCSLCKHEWTLPDPQ